MNWSGGIDQILQVTKNEEEKALNYIKLAADQGHPRAMFRLFMLHFKGECAAEQNLQFAIFNLNNAAKYWLFCANLWRHHLQLNGLGLPVNKAGAMSDFIQGSMIVGEECPASSFDRLASVLDGKRSLFEDFLNRDQSCLGLDYSDFSELCCLHFASTKKWMVFLNASSHCSCI